MQSAYALAVNGLAPVAMAQVGCKRLGYHDAGNIDQQCRIIEQHRDIIGRRERHGRRPRMRKAISIGRERRHLVVQANSNKSSRLEYPVALRTINSRDTLLGQHIGNVDEAVILAFEAPSMIAELQLTAPRQTTERKGDTAMRGLVDQSASHPCASLHRTKARHRGLPPVACQISAFRAKRQATRLIAATGRNRFPTVFGGVWRDRPTRILDI